MGRTVGGCSPLAGLIGYVPAFVGILSSCQFCLIIISVRVVEVAGIDALTVSKDDCEKVVYARFGQDAEGGTRSDFYRLEALAAEVEIYSGFFPYGALLY